MTEDKVKEFLDRLSACIEKRDLDACVSEAAKQAKEMGISPQRLLELSDDKDKEKQFKLEYVLALAAAQDLEEKAPAFKNAGRACYYLKTLTPQE